MKVPARSSAGGKGVEITPTEPRRLALTCAQIVANRGMIDAAVGHVSAAKRYPKQALVFVHGYNTSFDNALRRTGQIAYDIDFDGTVFLFSWPSRGKLVRYYTDVRTANASIGPLKDFVRRIVAETKVEKVHFIAHSLGNLVMLQALRDLAGSDLAPLIGQVVDAAPDVGRSLFTATTGRIYAAGKPVTLYASSRDVALRTSSAIHLRARAGYIAWGQPLIAPGVDTIDITEAGADLFALNHDTYASSPLLVADLRRLIETGVHPPDKRTPQMERAFMPSIGAFWRLKERPASTATAR